MKSGQVPRGYFELAYTHHYYCKESFIPNKESLASSISQAIFIGPRMLRFVAPSMLIPHILFKKQHQKQQKGNDRE